MTPSRAQVIVALAWGDVVVRVERWVARPGRAFVLPAPFASSGSRPLLRCDDRGEILVDRGGGFAPLPRGARMAAALDRDGGAGAYRTRLIPNSLVAIVEHAGLRSRRRTGPSAMLAILAPVVFALFASLALSWPRTLLDLASMTRSNLASELRGTRTRTPRALVATIITLEDTRPVAPDDVDCGWGCGAGTSESEAEIGLRPPPGSCLATKHVHVVEPGETLTSIARDYGFDDYRRLYDARLNADLVTQRPNPDRIYVGDVVVIPDPKGAADVVCVRS